MPWQFCLGCPSCGASLVEVVVNAAALSLQSAVTRGYPRCNYVGKDGPCPNTWRIELWCLDTGMVDKQQLVRWAVVGGESNAIEDWKLLLLLS